MRKINHGQMADLIKGYYKQKNPVDNKKVPLLIYGTFGIGKSFGIRDAGKQIAEQKGKEFVEWNSMSREDKDAVYENPKGKFIMLDLRLSEFDSTDAKGLPDIDKMKGLLEWRVERWQKLLANTDSDGILFFDELNLAPPLVLSSIYKIIYDRIINDAKISDDWLILGAGNTADDRAYTHELAAPIRDRGGEVELINPTVEKWTEWAIANNIRSEIIGFVNAKPSNLHQVDFDDNQKFTTERGWSRVNTLIQGIKKYNDIELMSSSAIGEGIAKQFVAFCKIKEEVDLDGILKNPEKLRSFEESNVLYFVVTAVAENYKGPKVKFDDILAISKVLDEIGKQEFVVLLWRICIKYNQAKFKKDFTNTKDTEVVDKYAKYVI